MLSRNRLAPDDRNYLVFGGLKVKYDQAIEDQNLLYQIIDGAYQNIAFSRSSHILLNIGNNKPGYENIYDSDHDFLNYTHPFVRLILTHYSIIVADRSIFKVVNAAFNFIVELQNSYKPSSPDLLRLNSMLMPLNSLGYVPVFTEADFYVKHR